MTLLALLRGARARILPWDANKPEGTAASVVETCPRSTILARIGKLPSYKNEQGSPEARALVLVRLRQTTGVVVPDGIAATAIADEQGDALDAIIAAVAAEAASKANHTAILELPRRRDEGHVYA